MHCSIRTACTVAVILGVICSVGGVLLTPWMLNVMSVPETVYGRAFAYTCIYFGGIWSMVLYNMAAGILRAYGDSKRPLYVLICCAVINIVGDLLLVGVLHLGVAGCSSGNGILTDCQRGTYVYMLRKTLHISKEEKATLVAAFLCRAYEPDDQTGISAGTAVYAVSDCEQYCAGRCQHDGYRSDCSLGNL